MAIKFNRSQTFATNGTVTAAGLHNLVDGLDIYQALITDQTALTSVSTADKLLIADADLTASDAPRSVTVQELFTDALTGGTYADFSLTGNLTYGTATGNHAVSTSASITTGTINNATLGTTTGTAAIFTSSTLGTTTATAANITNGTIQTLTSSTATITGGTFSGLLNSSTGTFSGSVNSTTGTISNLSTTLSGDFTISNGIGTLGTTGITAGTYGTSTVAVTLALDAKGRVTTVSTSAISATPADGSITPAKLSQPLTLGTSVASTSGTAIDFTGIPSWVKRISVILYRVSTNGASVPLVRIGTSSGIVSSGYESWAGYAASAGQNTSDTTGFILAPTGAYGSSVSYSGIMTILNISGNNWVSSFSATSGIQVCGGGSVPLSTTLDRIRITTTGGTDTFDAGSINIMYEG